MRYVLVFLAVLGATVAVRVHARPSYHGSLRLTVRSSSVDAELTLSGVPDQVTAHWLRHAKPRVAGPLGSDRQLTLADGQTLSWSFDSTVESNPSLGLVSAQDLLPVLRPSPARCVVEIVVEDGVAAVSPWRVNGGSSSYASLRRGALVHGELVSSEERLGTVWRSQHGVPPTDRELRDVETALTASLGTLPTARPSWLWLAPGEARSLLYRSVPGPGPVPLSAVAEPEDLKRTGRWILEGLSLASETPPTPGTDGYWLQQALMELRSERFAAERLRLLGVDPSRSLAAWRRNRREYYEARAPFSFPLTAGPEGFATAKQMDAFLGWRRYLCPLSLELVAEREGIDPMSEVGADGLYADPLRSTDHRELWSAATRAWSSGALDEVSLLDLVERKHPPIEFGAVLEDGASLRFITSSLTRGYLESCGCAVNPSGGAVRRNRYLADAHQLHDPIVIDLGAFFGRAWAVEETEEQIAGESELLRQVLALGRYDAVVPDLTDLARVQPSRGFMVRWIQSGEGPPLAACNLVHRKTDWRGGALWIESRYGPPAVVLGLSQPDFAHHVYTDPDVEAAWIEWSIEEPIEALERALEQLTSAQRKEALVVVAGSISHRLAEDIVRAVPQVDLILSGNPSTFTDIELDPEALRVEGSKPSTSLASARGFEATSNLNHVQIDGVPVFFTVSESYGVSTVDVSFSEAGGVECHGAEVEMIPSTHPRHGPTNQRIEDYYRRYAGDSSYLRKPLFEGNAGVHGGYAGSKACRTCHVEIYDQWLGSGHGQAFNTLRKVRRDYVPKCVRCHVVGMGEGGGYAFGGADPAGLAGVGCEVCHGGAADHVRQPSRLNVRRDVGPDFCAGCHDAEHSPEFEDGYADYRERIRHW